MKDLHTPSLSESESQPVRGPEVSVGEAAPPDESQGVAALTAALAGRDRFIGVVGHELRNSVAPMMLLADQLRAMAEAPDAPPLLASRVTMLTRNLGKLVATIDRVAEVSALRRGTLTLAPTIVDLREVVTEVCRDAAREAAAGGVELVLGTGPTVEGSWDRDRLRQVVNNLVSNAIRYSGGGRVELDVLDRGTAGELIVRDHGPGLEPELLARLFEPFAPLDRDRTRRSGGFGIGLWVVKTLCTAMQGLVTVENVSGGGARFCVVLPRG
jgi:signal transduction histidine kinase